MTAERKAQGWASIAIAALAVALVVAGLAIGGGPGQARKERRDAARMDDLNRLSGHIGCLSRDAAGRVMPTDLQKTKGCPDPVVLTDAGSGKPYRFEPIDADSYRLCADFELPAGDQRARGWTNGRRDGDCLVFDLPPPEPARSVPMDQFEVKPAG